MEQLQNFIHNRFVPPQSGSYLENFEPRTGKVYGQVPDSDERDALAAIEAASEARASWARTTKEERSTYLLKMAELIRVHSSELIEAEVRDNGKPIKLASMVDIPRSAANFEYFAKVIVGQTHQAFEPREDYLHYTRPTPLGVVTCISPWNLPLYLLTWKIAPALAAGNTVVAKPSEVTPKTAYLLGKIVQEAGLPPGVLNIVHGLGHKLGPTLTTDPRVRAVSFTGSTKTGEVIARAASPLFKKISLELGGKNPTVIFDDADLERTLSHAARASFANQGQICLCGSRILIHQSIYQRVKTELIKRADGLVMGDPLSPETQHGALVSREHRDKVVGMIELAKKDGARLLCGGTPGGLGGELAQGYFLRPTLLEGLPPEHTINQEEIFGPVASLIPFKTEEEAIEIANGVGYGLAASVWTENIHRAHRVAHALEAGMVWINSWMERDLSTPFGGVKASGVGREGGQYALSFFQEQKSIGLQIHPEKKS